MTRHMVRAVTEGDALPLSRFVKGASDALRAKEAKGFSPNLSLCPDTVMAFASSCATNPRGSVSFPLLFIEGAISGFSIVTEMTMPMARKGGVEIEKYGFIWALYKSPSITTTDGEKLSTSSIGNEDLLEYMERWSSSRGHVRIAGNCSLAFKREAAKKWGFKISHLVMERTIGS